jgi:hypothetical protein
MDPITMLFTALASVGILGLFACAIAALCFWIFLPVVGVL